MMIKKYLAKKFVTCSFNTIKIVCAASCKKPAAQDLFDLYRRRHIIQLFCLEKKNIPVIISSYTGKSYFYQ
jgi:hypothetical protein